MIRNRCARRSSVRLHGVVCAVLLGPVSPACKPDVERVDGELPLESCENTEADAICVPSTPVSLLAFAPHPGEPDSIAVLAGSAYLAIVDSGIDRTLRSFTDYVGQHPVQIHDRLMSCARSDGSRAIVYSGTTSVAYSRVWTPLDDGAWDVSPELLLRVMSPQCVPFDGEAGDEVLGLWTLDSVVRVLPLAADHHEAIDLSFDPEVEPLDAVPFGSAAADLDGDGTPEFVTLSQGEGPETITLHLFHGLSGATVQASNWDTGLARAAAPLLADAPDSRLFLAGDPPGPAAGTVTVFTIDPATWQPVAELSYTTVDSPSRALRVDLDHDDDLDLVVMSMPGNELWVHRANADGTFAEGEPMVLERTSMDIAIADLDGDDALDLITLPAGQDRVVVVWGGLQLAR